MENYILADGTPISIASRHIESVGPSDAGNDGQPQTRIVMTSGEKHLVRADYEDVSTLLRLLLQNR